MKVLIKLGGTLLDNPDRLQVLAAQLAHAARRCDLVLVHGGGKQVTQYLAERGIESRFDAGLRVSDATVIDAIAKVIAGSVNKALVAALLAAACRAVGVSGVDGNLTTAEALRPELQFVGRPTGTDAALLRLLQNGGYVPVVACLAGDGKGTLYNVNADQMAVSCAIGWAAERLIFLTDVAGVRDAEGATISDLRPDQVRQMIRSGIVQGGMQAKLEAACAAVSAGQKVTIASGAEPDISLRLLSGEKVGTQVSAEVPSLS